MNNNVNDLYLKRKIDSYLVNWKNNPNRKPLIVQGARQIGKTESIRRFAEGRYDYFIEIDFALQEEYRTIFDEGYGVDQIVKAISFVNPSFVFVPQKTLILFDEIQIVPKGATSLKSFKEDGRFDVICSGSFMGINYQEIESNAVGNKEDYFMRSMDFEEFLWAKGYSEGQIDDLFDCMKAVKPLPASIFNKLTELFRDYIVVGGMPEIVKTYVKQNNFSGILDLQKQIIRDYEEDITKYAGGLDKAKILSVYRKIPVFLGNENKKFFISKIEKNARSKNYVGVVDWLVDSGIVNISYCLEEPSLPLKGHYDPDNFRLYYMDTGLLIGSLDDEAQSDIRNRKIGFVFQSFYLMPRISAVRNVEVPLLYAGISDKERRERAMEMLTMVGMKERADHKPSELSGGQNQRVAIARAMINDPALILADEPTGALDSKTGHMVMDLFHKLHEEYHKTIVLITHSNELALETGRILTLSDGLIVKEGKGGRK